MRPRLIIESIQYQLLFVSTSITMFLKYLLRGILLLASLAMTFLYSILWKYLIKKPLGMQTPFDQTIKDLLLSSYVCANISSLVNLGFFVALPESLALFLVLLEIFMAISMFTQLLSTVLIRYMLIFHASWANEVSDGCLIKSSRIVNIILSTGLTGYEMAINDFRTGFSFHFLTGVPNEQKNLSLASVKTMTVFVLLAVLFMLIRIEVAKEDFKKGSVQVKIGYSVWTIRILAMVIFASGSIIAIRVFSIANIVDGNLRRLVVHCSTFVCVFNILPAIMMLRKPTIKEFASRSLSYACKMSNFNPA